MKQGAKISKQGFSLVELSIVLIIIGILVVGVLGGKRIIDNTKIQTVIAEINHLKASYDTFKMRYHAVPGDMSNAFDFWGTKCGATAGDCNGNGDGKINLNGAASEIYTPMLHMKLAGVITNGDFDGTVNKYLYPVNFSSLVGARFYDSNIIFNSHSITNINTLQIGEGVHSNGVAFLPSQSYKIDLKVDDGKPKSGVMGFSIASAVLPAIDTTDASCTNTSTEYYLASTSKGCNIVYGLGN